MNIPDFSRHASTQIQKAQRIPNKTMPIYVVTKKQNKISIAKDHVKYY